MKPFDSASYTIAHRPLHAWMVALADLSAPHSGLVWSPTQGGARRG
jgi:hypothetical protein